MICLTIYFNQCVLFQRCLEARQVEAGHEVATMTDEEQLVLRAAFLAERVDAYTKKNKRAELNPRKMKEMIAHFPKEEIERPCKMQLRRR